MDADNKTANVSVTAQAERRFRWTVMIFAVPVLMVELMVVSGWFSFPIARAIDELSLLAGAMVAAGACLWTAVRTRGSDRAWRILMGLGMAGWSLGQVVWTYARLILQVRVPLPAPSPADAGYLAMPVFATAALLVLARHRIRDPIGFRARPVRLVLDGVIAAGSLFTLTWATSLASIVRAGAPTPSAFAVALAYPLSGLVLLIICVFLASDPLVVWQRQLRLLGLGLLLFTVTSGVYAYLIGGGIVEIPLVYDVGFLTATVLVGLAALVPRADDRFDNPVSGYPHWGHLLTPYVPLLVTAAVIGLETTHGRYPDAVQLWAGGAVVTIVVIRQLITIIDNALLLRHLQDSRQQLEHQAFHDSLTQLANRALFHRRLDEAVSGRMRFGLLFIDLDDFKEVNDQSGHECGDAVLAIIGRRLLDAVRHTDLVARLGGDEFGVLVAGTDEPEHAAWRILDALAQEVVIEGRSCTVQASIGLVIRDETAARLSPDDLIRHADTAMYQAKREGKGRIVISTSGIPAARVRPGDSERTRR